MLEEDYFEILPGRPKRYFTPESLGVFMRKFGTLVLDNKGADTRRNRRTGLVRFIGRKGNLWLQ